MSSEKISVTIKTITGSFRTISINPNLKGAALKIAVGEEFGLPAKNVGLRLFLPSDTARIIGDVVYPDGKIARKLSDLTALSSQGVSDGSFFEFMPMMGGMH